MIHRTNIYQIEYERYLFFKRIKIFLISFLLCFAAALCMKILTRGVETQTIGDFTYELDSSTMTAKIIKYNGSASDVIIPPNIDRQYYVDGYESINNPEGLVSMSFTVTAIGNTAFEDNKNIVSVTGNSIEKIDISAFLNCTALTTVTLPKVTSVEFGAFGDCTALTTVTLPEATSIGIFAFYGCTALTTVTLPNAASIGGYAFGDCTALETIILSRVKINITNSLIEYNGKEQKPTFEIRDVKKNGDDYTDGDTVFQENTDYELKYGFNLINAGKKSVTIKFISDELKDIGSVPVDFEITKKDISELEIEVEEGTEHTYDGQEWKPNFEIKYGKINYTLTENDYDYPQDVNMTDAGEKTVTITLKDDVQNYTGSKTINNLKINKKDISELEVEVEEGTEHTYDGQEWKPNFEIKYGKINYTLTENDYDYPQDVNMTDAGEKTVTITLKDDVQNYTGSKTINNLKINPKNATNFDVEYEKVHIYDGKQPEFKIKDGEKELVLGTDYKIVSDKDIKEIGTHNVKIQYIGNYTGEKDIEFEVVADKSNWGEEVNNGGVINYVDSHGKTSAEVTGEEMIWLKESSDGTSAWYAIDNTNGTFKQGSRFWTQWLSPEANKEEFEKYYNKLDDEHKNQVENNKLWIFLTGVTDPDGNDYTNLDETVNYYIQLGEDWDEDDVKAVFISDKNDDVLQVLFEDVNTPEGTFKCAKILMQHFSPYAVYDPIDSTVPDTVPDYQKKEPEEKQKNDNNESLIPNDDKNSNNGKNFLINPTKENFGQAIKSGLITKISILFFLILIPSALIFNKIIKKAKINKD